MTAEPAAGGAETRAPSPPAGPGPSIRPPRQHVEQNPRGKRLGLLSLGALGVVYGDIGTSPLYAMKECFHPVLGVPPTVANVYGVLSLIVWALTLVVSVKYLIFVTRADNRGEGGILALLALVLQRQQRTTERRRRGVLIALGLFGAALLFGEGVITPAISVLGAMEGLEVASPAFHEFVVPATVVILIALFLPQRFGTARVGRIFGPVMILWFVTLAALGVREIAHHPEILLAINPWYALQFFAHNGTHGFLILGAVVLVITGAEALYADMGHFGRKPIRLAWFAMVLPALLLNYFGQGALLLRVPEAAANPFYNLAPQPLLYPLLLLATAAAIIASQALISGAFSLTRQATQLGYTPRITIIHTSHQQAGQIYVPEINKLLGFFCILLVVTFRSVNALAAAYGIAVTGTMVISTLMFFTVARTRWSWSSRSALAFLIGYLVIDLSFFGANIVKIEHGGWVPLVIAAGVFAVMTTWKRGREILRDLLTRASLPLQLFLGDVEKRQPPRVAGTAVFMNSDPEGTPVVLLHHLKHNKVLHEQVLLLSVTTAEIPEVSESERVLIEPLGQGFFRVVASYGFMETPSVPEIMQHCESAGLRTRLIDTSFYLGRERLIPTGRSRLSGWRKRLFIFMARNARSATEFFRIPPNRVVELGAQIEF